MSTTVLFWIVFHLVIFSMLAVDLGVVQRKPHTPKVKEALVWSVVWTLVALAFNAVVWFVLGEGKALQFLTGYLIERSLSFDNIFVFLVVFRYFGIGLEFQHRILFWGILGAIVTRLSLILAGIALLEMFHWLIYVLGGFLIVTGVRMVTGKEREVHPERSLVYRLLRPIMGTTDVSGGKFFVRVAGKLKPAPAFVVLLVVETTDVMFAFDSVPAVLAISQDPFVVYTSNIFAILGLRALYFAMAGLLEQMKYLHFGLAAILVFVGVKMVISEVVEIPVLASLGVIFGILALAAFASFSAVRTSPKK